MANKKMLFVIVIGILAVVGLVVFLVMKRKTTIQTVQIQPSSGQFASVIGGASNIVSSIFGAKTAAA